ncbi:uncharacterized protein NEMAJ01_2373 [Nematocida major]|uniref:uncharacterized protein n=1 Tax=Nematocida major TaxID=1912982 RepID=UPI0020078780|nr:uncharacterized protein NEMAJ01_2373 [Nematocida major]KAH9387477.1 hypothetical protein NEMAJ01_2373 [Nematocida major]
MDVNECGEEKPLNPIKDILIFERKLNERFANETKRRFIYFVLVVTMLSAYILYIIKEVYSTLWDVYSTSPVSLSPLLFQIYFRVLGVAFLLGYVFIRLLRKSSKVIKSLTAQLKLLNINFKERKIELCAIKTPRSIKTAINVFREEEQRTSGYWRKKE